MGQPYFQFKQFTVWHDCCAMKVGTDGTILGGWTDIPEDASSVLDIGSGTGLIALMVAQRSNKLTIDAIEIEQSCAGQGAENFKKSPWSKRLRMIHSSVQNWVPDRCETYDLIVSNPPYFHKAFKAGNQERNLARHTDTLSYSDLCSNVVRLLSEEGTFSCVLPRNSADQFIRDARLNGLYPHRVCQVSSTENGRTIRTLFSLKKKPPIQTVEERLIIQKGPQDYTDAYRTLLKDFMLYF